MTVLPTQAAAALAATAPDPAQRLAHLRALLAEADDLWQARLGRLHAAQPLTDWELHWLERICLLTQELTALDPTAPGINPADAQAIDAARRAAGLCTYTCQHCGQPITTGQGWEYVSSYPVTTPEHAKLRIHSACVAQQIRAVLTQLAQVPETDWDDLLA